MNQKTIRVREDLYTELQGFAKKYSQTVEQLVDKMLEKDTTDLARKELFGPGLTWGKSFEAHIMARVLPHDAAKLFQWQHSRDRLEFYPYENDTGAILIVNASEAVRRELSEKPALEAVS